MSGYTHVHMYVKIQITREMSYMYPKSFIIINLNVLRASVAEPKLKGTRESPGQCQYINICMQVQVKYMQWQTPVGGLANIHERHIQHIRTRNLNQSQVTPSHVHNIKYLTRKLNKIQQSHIVLTTLITNQEDNKEYESAVILGVRCL